MKDHKNVKSEAAKGEVMAVNETEKIQKFGTAEVNGKTEKRAKSQSKPKAPPLTACFPGLVDLVSDKDRTLFLVKTDRLFSAEHYTIDGVDHYPPDKSYLAYESVDIRDVLYYYFKEDYTLFEDIQDYLRKLAHSTQDQNLIATNYVYLTYLQDHRAVNYIPILLLYGPPERGKTRFGKAVISICYRGRVTSDVREPNIFRESDYSQASIFFDVMDMWKRLESGGLRDLILNRYERSGAKVARVLFPDKGAFRDTKYFNVFGPTIIATNKSVSHILESRTIDIFMQNMPKEFPYAFDHKRTDLRARLIAWRAKMMNSKIPDIQPINGLAGRFWDISKPLLRICNMVSPDDYDALVQALLKLARQRSEQKKDTTDYHILECLKLIIDENRYIDNKIDLKDLLDMFNEERTSNNRYTPQKMGRTLKGLGIETRRNTGYSKIVMSENMYKLFQSYGLSEELETQETQVTQKH